MAPQEIEDPSLSLSFSLPLSGIINGSPDIICLPNALVGKGTIGLGAWAVKGVSGLRRGKQGRSEGHHEPLHQIPGGHKRNDLTAPLTAIGPTTLRSAPPLPLQIPDFPDRRGRLVLAQLPVLRRQKVLVLGGGGGV